jgi:lipid A ethanolaminephosphotransferase
MQVDQGCLAARAGAPVSHDNLFSTVLGMMDITTETRDAALDLVQGCAAPPS